MQRIIITGLIFLFAFSIKAQEVGFSQFYANMLYLNPALAGTTKCAKLGLSYRNRYPTIPNAFTTYSASFDQYFSGIKGGIGLLAMRDEQGDGLITATSLSGMYSFTFKVSQKMYLKAGFQLGFTSRGVNVSDAIFPDMIDETTGAIGPSAERMNDKSDSNIDFATGIAGYARNYYFGVAVHHLTEWKNSKNNEEYYISERKYTAHGGIEIPIGGGLRNEPKYSISPNIIAQMQGEMKQINYGFYAKRKSLVAGLWFKQNFGVEINTTTLLLGYQRPQFKLGYSFDYPLSELKSDMFVAHELSLSFVIPCGKKKVERRAISCPKF